MKRMAPGEQEAAALHLAARQAIDGVAEDIKQLAALVQRETNQHIVIFGLRSLGKFSLPTDHESLPSDVFSAYGAAVVLERRARKSLDDGELIFALAHVLNAQRAIARAAGAALGVTLSSGQEIDPQDAHAGER